MNSNLYHFFGFFISKENKSMRVEGVFDTFVKESVSHSSLDLRLSSIIFKNQSLLTCKISCQDEIFKQVKTLDFVFSPLDQFYVAKVFAEKPFDRNAIGGRIEKDSTSKEEVGIIFIQVVCKLFFDFNFINEKFIQLENQKNKRESPVGSC